MLLGYTTMNNPGSMPVGPLAKALEERGYESLFIGEHSHIPASRATPYPAGGELPRPYLSMMDPFIGLTLAAAATSTLRLGLGVALPLENDIFVLAKSAATLDLISGGRLLFGVGVGWNVEELANHRLILWGQRYRALEESVGALRRLWMDDDSEFHGEFYDFDPVWSYPKPAHKPHPPVLCGTGGRLGTAHAVRWADGWMPMDIALGDVAKKMRLCNDAAMAAGRTEPLPVTMVAFGDPTLETLHRYRELGVERVVLGSGRVGWDEPSTTMGFVDRYAPMIAELA